MLGTGKDNVEFVDAKVERDEIKGFSLKVIIDGSLIAGKLIARNITFILFLVMLAIIYIGNRYHAERMVRQIVTASDELKDLRAEQITTASQLMNYSKPSTIEDMVEEKGLGIKQPIKPPYKIVQDF